MNLFKPRTLSVWQVGAIKISVFAIALAIGANWASYLLPYTWWLVAFGLIVALYVLSFWCKKS